MYGDVDVCADAACDVRFISTLEIMNEDIAHLLLRRCEARMSRGDRVCLLRCKSTRE